MKKTAIYLLVILGLVFLVLAIYYWVTPAGSLPHFFPATVPVRRITFETWIGGTCLGFAAWVLAWFWSGSKPAISAQDTEKK